MSLGSFSSEEEFTVIRNLTVDSLQGADFLKEHRAEMDCGSSTLTIGNHKVPMLIRQQNARTAVTAPIDMEIPGRTIQLIHGQLQGDHTSFNEALVEPASRAPPTHLCVAQTLSPVLSGKVNLQVMNVSPTPVTIYKGMKLGEATPRHNVMLVDSKESDLVTRQEYPPQHPVVNLDSTDLTPTEKTQFCELLA